MLRSAPCPRPGRVHRTRPRRRGRARRRLRPQPGTRALRDADRERRALRREPRAASARRHDRRGQGRLPLVRRARLPVPSTGQLRHAQRPREEPAPRGGRTAGQGHGGPRCQGRPHPHLEYYFPFAGPGRWTSALAQSAGAQALARTGALLKDDALLAGAGATYREIARDLSQSLGGGTWVKEYSYSDMAVLNAQLQSIVSLTEYARITKDTEAQRYVERLSTAARTLLPEFDTGCWSRYSLGGSPASDSYHRYHVNLLDRLAEIESHTIWAETGARWKGYLSPAADDGVLPRRCQQQWARGQTHHRDRRRRLVAAPVADAAPLICLDPGHARTPNLTTEPIGRGRPSADQGRRRGQRRSRRRAGDRPQAPQPAARPRLPGGDDAQRPDLHARRRRRRRPREVLQPPPGSPDDPHPRGRVANPRTHGVSTSTRRGAGGGPPTSIDRACGRPGSSTATSSGRLAPRTVALSRAATSRGSTGRTCR